MPVTRRALLRFLAATALSSGWPFERTHASTGAKPFFLLIEDIGADLTREGFLSVLSPIVQQGIPVGLIPDGLSGPGETRRPARDVIEAMRRFVGESPALGEFVASAPEITGIPPYFQVRAAAEARKRLLDLLGPVDPGAFAGQPSVLSIAGDAANGVASIDGARAAGFRNVVLLRSRGGASAGDPCLSALPCLGPAPRWRLSDPMGAILASLRSAIAVRDKPVLALSLAGVAELTEEGMGRRAAEIADAIGGAMRAGRISPALPRDQVGWFAAGTERLLGLRLAAPGLDDRGGHLALRNLSEMLRDAGFSFSLPPSAEGAPGHPIADCTTGAVSLPAAACLAAGPLSADALSGIAASGSTVVVHTDAGSVERLDANGVLHLDETVALEDSRTAGEALGSVDPVQDVLVSVAPSAYATEEDRQRLVGALRSLAAETHTRFLSVPDYAAAILPVDPVYRVMLATRADTRGVAVSYPAPSAADRAAFAEDARIAWSYIERLTDARTGLCPSTASFDGVWSSYYQFLTMWDLGSLIQATIAGHELGLIGDTEFLDRANALVRALPFGRLAGLVLPSEEIRTDRLETSRAGFNLCDAGRLLSALADLDGYGPSAGMAAESVARWSLAGVVRDGQLLTYTGSGFAPFVRSHCTHYAARAFRRWGLEASSPYESMQGASITDARMNLLYEVARIGAIGAEPLLLEAVEMGASEPSAYLSDVLYTAQARSFARDGRLVCASESPMDRPPWFVTQGLRVDGGDAGEWEVQSANPAAAYRTPEFGASAGVISTKAAFLWAAVRPGDYSARLLEHVRRRARVCEAGYSAGIYAATDEAMENYSDINTNGIILQAIAHALRGGRPRLQDAAQ